MSDSTPPSTPDDDSIPATLRAAREDDIPTIQRVGVLADARYREVGHPELDDGVAMPVEVARAAIREGRLWVAEAEGALIGWIYTGRLGQELCIGQVSVLPEAGRRGAGTALLKHVIAEARRAGEPSIVLNTQGDVPWCAAWFARHDFAVVHESKWSMALAKLTGEQMAAGVDWSARVHMRLHLL